jgi:hypothetical protein
MKQVSGCLLALFIFASLNTEAQMSVKDSSIAFSMIAVTGSYQVPGGEMADRFGNNFTVGASFQRKLKSNWLWGADFNLLFGGEVKENTILSGLMTSQGYIIGADGNYADVLLHERGYSAFLKAGRIFPVLGPNKNCGLTVTIGGGFIQHKIRIEDKGNKVPQLSDEYKKGYDRLTNGFCLSQFLGYTNFSNSRRINFYAGIEAMEGFTQNRRTVNIDTGLRDDTKRMDFFLGLKVGWIIPLFKKLPKEYYYD